ncbi:CDGSH iron-sulfur domain-containing protein [Chloroflexota bacterium]
MKDQSANYGHKIRISKNGPYLVSGGLPLTQRIIGINTDGYSYEWREGKEYPPKENYALCRCGQSKNKPFCDGTHIKVNFDGTETASRKPYLDQVEKIDGANLDLTDAEELCAATRFCDRAGGIWKLTKKSIDPDTRLIAIEEAGNCPSGRLVVWDKQGKAIEPEFELSIGLVEDPEADMTGPIWVRGGTLVESADGSTYETRNRVALCRCGKSSNKPFCDGSHYK